MGYDNQAELAPSCTLLNKELFGYMLYRFAYSKYVLVAFETLNRVYLASVRRFLEVFIGTFNLIRFARIRALRFYHLHVERYDGHLG